MDKIFHLKSIKDYLYSVDDDSIKEKRKEYTRLRSVAQKRLKNLGKNYGTESRLYERYNDTFKKLSDMENNRELKYLLQDMYNFLSKKTSTVSGIKKVKTDTIKTLRKNGYNFINDKNFNDFTRFMEYFRERMLGQEYDSAQVADRFENFFKKEGEDYSPENLEREFMSWRGDNDGDL